jgi:hypothetical protein
MYAQKDPTWQNARRWNDNPCGDARPFVCKRAEDPAKYECNERGEHDSAKGDRCLAFFNSDLKKAGTAASRENELGGCPAYVNLTSSGGACHDVFQDGEGRPLPSCCSAAFVKKSLFTDKITAVLDAAAASTSPGKAGCLRALKGTLCMVCSGAQGQFMNWAGTHFAVSICEEVSWVV